MLSDKNRVTLNETINKKAQTGEEDADYVCCAIVDLVLVRTDAELDEWLEQYGTMLSPELIEQVRGPRPRRAAECWAS